MPRIGWAVWSLTLMLAAAALTGCQSGRASGAAASVAPSAATPASKTVWNGHYAQDIQPIFNDHCVTCHGPNRADNGLRLDSYEGVMKGTNHGPVVVAGDPDHSALISVVQGSVEPSIRMPHGGQKLTEQDVQNLRLWIAAGASSN
ncbi:MAG TPA: c-type cytochrome domain-containing protein [Chloroflexota bacterium]|nr:c-type cytochrome domain-containing protein [Chloroflexota bacterium]